MRKRHTSAVWSWELAVSTVLLLFSVAFVGVGLFSAIYMDCRYPPTHGFVFVKEACILFDISARQP
jgi:hypothetical protein